LFIKRRELFEERPMIFMLSLLFVLVHQLFLDSGVGIQSAVAQEKEILGWAEKVYIPSLDFVINAKLDTGADFSSLHAEDMKLFTKNKEQWVRFKVTNRKGEEVKLERVVTRSTRIKKLHGSAEERPVITLGVCLGSSFLEEEVSLVNRSKFRYNLLIGRSFLAGNAIVDPSTVYASNPSCSKPRQLKNGLYKGENDGDKPLKKTKKKAEE
jgi:hypothetical protein